MVAPAQQAPQLAGNTVYVSFSAEITVQTTETLLGTCADIIARGASGIYLLLSTPGGNVMSGINAYNVLKALPVDLTIHNVGTVASIGNAVFLAGAKRFSVHNATFMFHGIQMQYPGPVSFEERQFREQLESLKAEQKRYGAIIAARSNLQAGTEIDGLFLETQTRDPAYALSKGIIHEIREASIPKGSPFIQLIFKR